MPRNAAPEIRTLVSSFASQLVAAVERSVADRVRSAVAHLVGQPIRRGPGRPPKNPVMFALAPLAGGRPRRKAPKQLCPVPGCKNPAAPVFGMVCAKHKDVPRAKIKQYREQRRKQKESAAKKAA